MGMISKPDTGGMERYFILGAESMATMLYKALIDASMKQAQAQSYIGVVDNEQATSEGAEYALDHLEEITKNLRAIQAGQDDQGGN